MKTGIISSSFTELPQRVRVICMVFNANFNNISDISWQSVRKWNKHGKVQIKIYIHIMMKNDASVT